MLPQQTKNVKKKKISNTYWDGGGIMVEYTVHMYVRVRTRMYYIYILIA